MVVCCAMCVLCLKQPDELPADDSLPDQVLVAMLKREVLLTKAKLHYSLFEHICQDRQLRTWRAQLKQVCCAHMRALCRVVPQQHA